MIRSKPSTDEYREAWERVFGGDRIKGGDRVVWHVPKHQFDHCTCDRAGAVVTTSRQDNGYLAVIGVQLDVGGLIDPSCEPNLLKLVGEPCPLAGRGGRLISVGASVD